jgi:ankyrin repeat protein
MTGKVHDASELLAASFKGDAQAVSFLLDGGCDINAQDPVSRAPLLLAIENLQTEIVRILLIKGADPNRSGHAGVTPLHAAVDAAVEEAKHAFDLTGQDAVASTTVVALLLAAGADPNRMDEAGKTAHDWARRVGHLEAEKLLHSSMSRTR